MNTNFPIIISGGDAKSRIKRAEEESLNFGVKTNSFDFNLIKPETSIGIEKFRELIPIINLKPFQSPNKIVVIEDAFKMTLETQNAFLKTLEETPGKSIIFLLVENPEQLISTILSRCRIINLLEKTAEENELIDFNKIKTMSIGLKFKTASEIAENKQKALEWLEKAIISLRKDLLKNDNAKFIKLCLEAKNKINRNVNTRLVIENLLMEMV